MSAFGRLTSAGFAFTPRWVGDVNLSLALELIELGHEESSHVVGTRPREGLNAE